MNPQTDMSILRAQRTCFVLGVAGLVASGAGFLIRPKEFFVAYLFGLLVWLGIALGSMGFCMVHHLTGGRWGYAVRRIFEAAMSTLPFMALLLVPVLFGLRELYPWADPAQLAANDVLKHKHGFMNPTGFVIRAAVVFVVWTWLARWLTKYSALQDVTTSPEPTKKLRKLSGPGLVIYPLTVTFAYVDWVMSMEPDWYSTVFPLLVCVGQMLSALAFALILAGWLGDKSALGEIISKENFRHLGNLLLAFTMTWAYLAYSQLLIIWSGDLPHEITWYLHRITGGWRWVALALLLFHFFGPFLFLLFRATKQSARMLVIVASVIFVTHVVDVWWLVAPSIYRNGFHVSWIALVALIGIGGIWLAIFFKNLGSKSVIPLNDPRFAIALPT